MPKYRVRLEDPDSDHYRITSLIAASEEEARAIVERRERRNVEFRLSDEELAEMEDQEAAAERWEDLPGRVRAHLHTHRQSEPYRITMISTEGLPREGARPVGEG